MTDELNNSLFKNGKARLKWPTLAAISVLPLVIYACATPPPQPLETRTLATDVEQVRDPLTGRLYYIACNPCQAPTTKTLAMPASPVAAVANPVTQVASAQAPTVPAATPSDPDAAKLKMDNEFESVKRVVPFSFAKAAMGPNGRLAVKELIALAKKSEKIYVRGRTDSVGSVESNRLIAMSRASTVRQEFIVAGVKKAKITSTYCTDCFLTSNDTEAGRRANRRVDVELVMPRKIAMNLPAPVYARAEIETPLLASDSSLSGWHEQTGNN